MRRLRVRKAARSEIAAAFDGRLDELRATLGVEVDLVMVGALKNRTIREDVDRTKRVLFPG